VKKSINGMKKEVFIPKIVLKRGKMTIYTAQNCPSTLIYVIASSDLKKMRD
jgi:hypothetical protein